MRENGTIHTITLANSRQTAASDSSARRLGWSRLNVATRQRIILSGQSRVARRVAVLQSNYLPWKGYFDLIHDVDLFVFYDDVQYTTGDWRNRNRIKTPRGVDWLTIPVPRGRRLICEVEVTDPHWRSHHWAQIRENYSRARFFEQFRPFCERLYLHQTETRLSAINQALIATIARDFLGIHTEFADSRQYHLRGHRLDRLLDLLEQVGATEYITGPAAKAYVDPMRFVERGISLVWKDYLRYPEYPQFFPPFSHHVTILDLLFHTGPAAPGFIWG
jgi:hypothetical protein